MWTRIGQSKTKPTSRTVVLMGDFGFGMRGTFDCEKTNSYPLSPTRDFCADCTRIRLTADGQIRNCLYSEEEFGLLDCLRQGGNDEDIAQTLKDAMWAKQEDGRAAQERARSGLGVDGRSRESMAQIWG
jgi:molybdenum cofactor biosynthesis enzyme MoaA